MKKLMALFRKIRAGFAVRMHKRPFLMTILILISINLLMLVIASVFAIAIDGGAYPNIITAFISSVKWLVTPNSLLDIKNIKILVLAAFVCVVGMVLFTGTIIAMTTNYLRAYIIQKGDAKGKLSLSGHYVILNYNTKILAMLIDLMFNDVDDTVIILSAKSKEFIRDALAAELALVKEKPNSKLNLVIRKGNPFSVSELNDICINEAKGIIVMENENAAGGTSAAGELSAADYDALKLTLTIAEEDIPDNCPVIIETQSYNTVKIINDVCGTIDKFKGKKFSPFSYNRKLGQFMALSVICPYITNVLYDLLSFIGCEFYAVPPADIEEYLKTHNQSIPVYTLDKTYVLAESLSKTKVKRNVPFTTERRVAAAEPQENNEPATLLIIGKNKKTEYMLEALRNNAGNVKILTYATEDRKTFLYDLENQQGEKTAVILSDDTVRPSDYDINVFLTLIDINKKFGARAPFKIITEILDPKNQISVERFNISSVIVSNRIISFFATQLITQSDCENFYEEIFTQFKSETFSGAGGDDFDVLADDAENVISFEGGMNFSSCAEFIHAVYYGTDKKVLPLGIIENNENNFFCKDMDKKRNFEIKRTDKLIYVRYK